MNPAPLAIVAATSVPHPINWWIGWSMILAAFVGGAIVGIWFHQENFLGGYTSFRRRIVRLGHIALAELGILNVVFALSPWPEPGEGIAWAASACFVVGGLLMPLVCFLTGWRAAWRHAFFIPVLCLIAAVIFTLWGGALSLTTLTPQPGVP